MKGGIIATPLIAVLAGAAYAQTDRQIDVDAMGGRATGANNAATGISDEQVWAQDIIGLPKMAVAKLEPIWPDVQKQYSYIGDSRGLLIEVKVSVFEASASTPAPQKRIENVYIVGTGTDPEHAWAENNLGDLSELHGSDFRILPGEIWFLWITPGRNGWPKSTPDYKTAKSEKLLDRRTAHEPTVIGGIGIRGELLAHRGLRVAARMNAIAAVVASAEANATNTRYKALAAQLRKDVEVAAKQLAEIDERLKHELEVAGRAEQARLILDRAVLVGNGANQLSEAINSLGDNAPRGPTTEQGLREHLNDLTDENKKLTKETIMHGETIERDIDGKVESFDLIDKDVIKHLPSYGAPSD
jgi:hypothetical protein